MTRRKKDPLAGFLHPADAIVPCKQCGAEEGEPCEFTSTKDAELLKPGYVHFGRRMSRLLLTAGAPHKREEFEREAVNELREFLKQRSN